MNEAIRIGGIMGSDATGCDADTKNILIECAYFNPLGIATTGRKLGITSRRQLRTTLPIRRVVGPTDMHAGMVLASKGLASSLYLRNDSHSVPCLTETNSLTGIFRFSITVTKG